MRTFKKKIPLYFGQLIIEQAKSLRKVEKKYGLQTTHGSKALTFRNHDKNGYSRYVLAFGKRCTPNHVAHEALHLVALLYEDRGVALDIENDEPQCYLLGWIVGECHKHLKLKK